MERASILGSSLVVALSLQVSACGSNANHWEGAGIGAALGTAAALASGVEPVTGAILGMIAGALVGEEVDQRQSALQGREKEILAEIAAAASKSVDIGRLSAQTDALVAARDYWSSARSDRDAARNQLRRMRERLWHEMSLLHGQLGEAQDTLDSIEGHDRAARTARGHLRKYIGELKSGLRKAEDANNKINKVLK